MVGPAGLQLGSQGTAPATPKRAHRGGIWGDVDPDKLLGYKQNIAKHSKTPGFHQS